MAQEEAEKKKVEGESMTSADYYFDSYAHFGTVEGGCRTLRGVMWRRGAPQGP